MDVSDATALITDVLSPKTFYAGEDPEIKVGTITQATDLSAVDPDLVPANIKAGMTIFSKVGADYVRDISDADAVEAEVRAGIYFYSITGARKTGTLPDKSLNPANQTVEAGYYTATTLSAIDGDLVSGSIKSGVTIFGVTGSDDVRDVSDADALASEVLEGKTFYAVGGARKTGTYIGITDYRKYGPLLTVAIFDTNPATGDMTDPQNLNNGATATYCRGGVGKYAEVDLGGAYRLKQWRKYGHADNECDGESSIQIWNVEGAAWEDWVIEIPSRLATWSDWADGPDVIASKIRVLITIRDSSAFYERIGELEVRYSA